MGEDSETATPGESVGPEDCSVIGCEGAEWSYRYRLVDATRAGWLSGM